MNMHEISLEMTFDAGHRIVGHKGKCARLHGHTYRVEIRAAGPLRDPGFVVDFGDIKDLVNEWDHVLLLWEEDSMASDCFAFADGVYEGETDLHRIGIRLLSFNPTAENMARDLAERISFSFDLLSVSVTLWETPKASAFYIVEKESVSLD